MYDKSSWVSFLRTVLKSFFFDCLPYHVTIISSLRSLDILHPPSCFPQVIKANLTTSWAKVTILYKVLPGSGEVVPCLPREAVLLHVPSFSAVQAPWAFFGPSSGQTVHCHRTLAHDTHDTYPSWSCFCLILFFRSQLYFKFFRLITVFFFFKLNILSPLPLPSYFQLYWQ